MEGKYEIEKINKDEINILMESKFEKNSDMYYASKLIKKFRENKYARYEDEKPIDEPKTMHNEKRGKEEYCAKKRQPITMPTDKTESEYSEDEDDFGITLTRFEFKKGRIYEAKKTRITNKGSFEIK